MAIEISEIEIEEKCAFCKESMKGFVVFGRHTIRKTGGNVELTEYVYKKRIEDEGEILSMLVTGKCPSCNVYNVFNCDYNLEKNSYKLLDLNF